LNKPRRVFFLGSGETHLLGHDRVTLGLRLVSREVEKAVMDALRIQGGHRLSGEVSVSGSKNASLPILAAALLTSENCVLGRVPDLVDVRTMSRLLASMGVQVAASGQQLNLQAKDLTSREALYELVRTMRASILVLGPLLARFGEAKVSLPGGCAIGARPIDQHLKGLEKMGAKISLEHGYVHGVAPRLTGAEIVLDMPSVGATENLMLAATLAEGTTVLRNAAREPEIVDLGKVLRLMGADIEGVGSSKIVIRGVNNLGAFEHEVVADRIEFGTFLIAGAMVGAPLVIRGGVSEHQAVLIDKLRASGVSVEIDPEDRWVKVERNPNPKAIHNVTTAPYPGFPTDMQAQLMTYLSCAEGVSTISEDIFENRFMHVAELRRLGAKIRVEGGKAVVRGVAGFSGTTVMATDLRASASLVLAGLVAQGETVVRRVYHLDRGYEHIESKLNSVGAQIERFKE
jgi:UDP-N-acetylglucosamine 1-carboxyvinyltransferase